ncbi:MAG TPA: ABC transporter ATP-binding protein [Solirubrobacteraceae bacterium]|jgi:ABC-2 type transport system ATP-binding protein|nr:ABC transporter ATP-binding protein [Solirubrobacteraceae bacterium]
MTVLTASGLTKRFESTCAIDRVDLVVGEGEVKGLLGPNGAGKTTLLRMLLGLVAPDEGTIELLGHALDRSGALALDGVSGFVEEPTFYPYLSGRANLEVLAELDGAGAQTRINNVLAQVELTGRAGDRVGGYSSGMRQRLGIAAALMRAPRLLLLDEPTSALDPAGARFVVGLVRALAQNGVAVLLSSHQIGEVEGACDSFSVLSRGRVVWEGSAGRMLAEAPPSAYRVATSDDARALALAHGQQGIKAERSPAGELTVQADDGALDPFVLALGRADVAVRRLELSMSPLESMFFALTEHAPRDPRVFGAGS